MVRGVALSFAVLLAVFEIGSCLKCYQCNSAASPECKDGTSPPSKFATQCDPQAYSAYNRINLFFIPSQFTSLAGASTFCYKMVTPTGETARTCLSGTSLSEVNQLCSSLDKSLGKCSYCQSDLCNGSSAISASLPVALLALVASYLFYKQ